MTRDLGFSAADRAENIRRVAEVGKLMVDAGLIVLVSLISPSQAERQGARALLAPGEFVEIFVDAPLDVAEGRDPKGLYKKARRGELPGFTGIDAPYEAPVDPEIRVETGRVLAAEAAAQILGELQRLGLLEGPSHQDYTI